MFLVIKFKTLPVKSCCTTPWFLVVIATKNHVGGLNGNIQYTISVPMSCNMITLFNMVASSLGTEVQASDENKTCKIQLTQDLPFYCKRTGCKSMHLILTFYLYFPVFLKKKFFLVFLVSYFNIRLLHFKSKFSVKL